MQVSRPVTYLAAHIHMQAFAFQIDNILMAIGTGSLVDIFGFLPLVFLQGIAAVVAVLAIRLGSQKFFGHQEEKGKSQEDEKYALELGRHRWRILKIIG